MRFLQLSPPRQVTALPPDERAGRPVTALKHQFLADPAETDFPPRHLLDPRDGWFRRTERGLNKFLSRRIFPRVPRIREAYAAILDRSLTIAEGQIPLIGLGGVEGVRVLVISDIHVGPFLAPEVLRRTLERLLETEPDLILLPGDFATVCVEEVEEAVQALSTLRAPLGVYGVLGNHDHYTEQVSRLVDLLSTAGIQLLQNEAVSIDKDGSRIHLVGVDDLLCGDPRLSSALAARPEGVPTVMMSHNPDLFPEAVREGVSLVLAGHTHGGQIRMPGLPVLVRMSRYRLDEGRFQVGGSELIVTRGLGVTGLPLRLACPPEALLLQLVPAAAETTRGA
jgi:predicted MPP superfamily phosphohydrolase